jgi:hypothetical protein
MEHDARSGGAQQVNFSPQQIHELGEGVPVPLHVAQAAAWRVAAALIERHPDDLYAVELHPGMGQHHQLALCVHEASSIAASGPIFLMGLSRGGRLNGRSRMEKDYVRFHWLDVLLTRDLDQEIIQVLEQGEDLSSPEFNPPINSKSIGALVIATALATRLLSPNPLEANNGVYDSSGMGGSAVCTEYFLHFDSMIDEIAGYKNQVNLRGHPAYRFWFVGPAYGTHRFPPILGVDTWTGRVWNKSITAGNLMDRYKNSNSDIYKVISELIPNEEPETIQ